MYSLYSLGVRIILKGGDVLLLTTIEEKAIKSTSDSTKKVTRSDHRVYAGAKNHNTVSNDRRWCKRSRMHGLPRTKETKTHIYRCQMEELGAYKALLVAGEFAG